MKVIPFAIQRLMDEVKNEAGQPHCYDRAHNRHNRSGATWYPGRPDPAPNPPDPPQPPPDEKEADETSD